MKQLLIIALFCASISLQAQNKNPKPKTLIGFSFSPDYSFRSLKNTSGNNALNPLVDSRNKIEIPKFGYTTGLNACFNLSQFISIETGILFSNRGYSTKKQELVYATPEPNPISKAQFNYTYQYISIPVKAKFSFGKQNLRLIAGMGLQANLLLTTKEISKFEYATGVKSRSSSSSTAGFNKVDISPLVSLGVDAKLNNKMNLFIEPTFRYGIIKTKDAPIKENLWNVGLNLGVYYELN